MTTPERLQMIFRHLYGVGQPSVQRRSIEYRYTLGDNVLTNEQRAFYEENGYLIIRNLIDHKLIDECRNHFIDICNGKAEAGQMVVMKDKFLLNTGAKGEHLINKVQDILFDDVFIKYATYSSLLRYVESFIGPDITGFHSQIINKPPSEGNQPAIHPMHQDLYYFPIRPANRIVGTWTAMEKVTVDNGCLFVAPGSHKTPLQPHDYPKFDVNYMFYEVKGFDSFPKVYLEMEKGDTVFFHPLLGHGSGPNITKHFRKAITCHYAANNCYFLENPDASQDLIMKDIQKIIKLRGMTLSHREIFQLRQKLIKGKPGILQQL